MKENIIETAGKAWQFLGQNGESEVTALPKRLKEKSGVVYQSLGWLAREDKINYSEKRKKTFVSLIDSEMQIFNSVMKNIQQSSVSAKKPRKRARSA